MRGQEEQEEDGKHLVVMWHLQILPVKVRPAEFNWALLMGRLLQETIRTAFKDCTTLTIAHRLHTIMDSDRILILSAGSIVEFESPKKLLKVPLLGSKRSCCHISPVLRDVYLLRSRSWACSDLSMVARAFVCQVQVSSYCSCKVFCVAFCRILAQPFLCLWLRQDSMESRVILCSDSLAWALPRQPWRAWVLQSRPFAMDFHTRSIFLCSNFACKANQFSCALILLVRLSELRYSYAALYRVNVCWHCNL